MKRQRETLNMTKKSTESDLDVTRMKCEIGSVAFRKFGGCLTFYFDSVSAIHLKHNYEILFQIELELQYFTSI